MKTSLRLSLSLLAVALPMAALAAPGNVSGVAATVQEDGIHVTWNQANGDIAAYKVFYSHASILNNAGLFDEFEVATGTDTSHVLRNVPASNDVYVAVLAVDSQGDESPFFTEEAHVVLGDASATSSEAPIAMPGSAVTSSATSNIASIASATSSTASVMANEDVLRLLSIDVVSSTGVVLHFSHDVAVDPAHATEALVIETASGTKLQMKRFLIQGTDIHVDTAVQERGVAYKVTIGLAVSATGSAGQKIAITPDQAPVLFSGHPTGRMPSASSASSSTATSAPERTEVMQLRLRAQPTGKAYKVEATWQPATGAVGYSVAQTVDGGRTFTEAKKLKPEERDLMIPDVPAGSFGIRVRAIYTDESLSKGVVQTIALPKISGGTTGSVTGGSSELPNSGPALWVAIAAAVSAATWLQMKRKEEVEAVA